MRYNERIRALWEDSDLTQSAVAELLHIGQKTYSDYERGKTRIPIDSILLLAKHYNISLDYICGASDVKKQYPQKKPSYDGFFMFYSSIFFTKYCPILPKRL